MLQYYVGLLQHARLRAQVLRENPQSSRGASALEWAIISAIIVAVAMGLAIVIRNVVTEKQEEIGNV